MAFLEFISQNSNTWIVMNKKTGDQLGTISYFSKWKKYCFYPYDETYFCSMCLREIVVFMEGLNAKH